MTAGEAGAANMPREAVLREYDRGALVREERVPAQQRPVGDPVAGRPVVKTRRKREVRMGETIFKGAPSYDLMLQLQLGIRWSVGRITPERSRELGDADFRQGAPQAAISARFPRAGSSTTPPHASHDFKWKDYCPMVRHAYGVCHTAHQCFRSHTSARRCSASCANASASTLATTCCRCAVRCSALWRLCSRADANNAQATWRYVSCLRLANRAACSFCRQTGASLWKRCARLRWCSPPALTDARILSHR